MDHRCHEWINNLKKKTGWKDITISVSCLCSKVQKWFVFNWVLRMCFSLKYKTHVLLTNSTAPYLVMPPCFSVRQSSRVKSCRLTLACMDESDIIFRSTSNAWTFNAESILSGLRFTTPLSYEGIKIMNKNHFSHWQKYTVWDEKKKKCKKSLISDFLFIKSIKWATVSRSTNNQSASVVFSRREWQDIMSEVLSGKSQHE